QYLYYIIIIHTYDFPLFSICYLFLFHPPPSTPIYTLSLHDALPISRQVSCSTPLGLPLPARVEAVARVRRRQRVLSLRVWWPSSTARSWRRISPRLSLWFARRAISRRRQRTGLARAFLIQSWRTISSGATA